MKQKLEKVKKLLKTKMMNYKLKSIRKRENQFLKNRGKIFFFVLVLIKIIGLNLMEIIYVKIVN